MMTTILAISEHKSKAAAPKENIYSSKLSIEESFAIDERMKITPSNILAAALKDQSL